MSNSYKTDYKIGQDNIRPFGMEMHNPVFALSALLIIAFVCITLVLPSDAKALFDAAKGGAITHFDWFFMLAGNIFVLFCFYLIFSPLHKIRIGGQDATPDFTTLSWFSMLFAAGMGIGLMFWSVAEPTAYYTGWYGTPLNTPANTPEAAAAAMGATMFHWGLHPWAIYAVVGLSLGFFRYNKNLPLTIRSSFFPLIGDKSWGFFGNIIDIIAVLATMFGLATSLGLGAQQAASGLNFLFDIPNTLETQIYVIIGVTAVAIISVIRGLDGGVKLLSNLNMGLATLLLLFVLVFGPTIAIFMAMINTGHAYIDHILPLSNWINRDDETFFHGWTVFYWAWWISWSPFVGMFIARISKGRTVREFITAVLVVPTLVTLVWMSVFGGTALDQIQNNVGALANGLTEVPLAMFQMFESLPLTNLISFTALVLVLVFFITSSDSGSLVIDSITAGGKLDAPTPQRIFWAVVQGSVAAALLVGGGNDALGALQAASISVGLPFTAVLLVMCLSLYKGLKHEHRTLTQQ